VADVTIPDGLAAKSGAIITKTWRLKNSGSGPWPQGVKLVHVDGPLVPLADAAVPLASAGEVVDISVPILLPEQPSRTKGVFRLATKEGEQFGHRVWVDVDVQKSIPPSVCAHPKCELAPHVNVMNNGGKFCCAMCKKADKTKKAPKHGPRCASSKKGLKAQTAPAKQSPKAKPTFKNSQNRQSTPAKKDAKPNFKYSTQLMQLQAMGFTDEDQLKELLSAASGNLTRVLAWLC
jgi:hypothetical protein